MGVSKASARWLRIDFGTKGLAQRITALRCGLDRAAWQGSSATLCADHLRMRTENQPWFVPRFGRTADAWTMNWRSKSRTICSANESGSPDANVGLWRRVGFDLATQRTQRRDRGENGDRMAESQPLRMRGACI